MTPELAAAIAIDEWIPAAKEPIDCGPTPAFGRHFAPGMLVSEWREGAGWRRPRIAARSTIAVDPAAVVFHYGQAVFEGMKAHRQPDGRLAIFRLADHAARFVRSAERMAMPPVPPEMFAACLTRFVAHQAKAVPNVPGVAFYLRPLHIGTEAGLGIRAAKEFLFVVMGCAVAPYFAGPAQRAGGGGHGGGGLGLRVLVVEDHVRAAPGGTGAVKAAGNYGRGLLSLTRAKEIGCDQVIWLDAVERSWIEEMEGMNIFFVRDGAVVTPPTSDTILAGITRASLLAIAADEGIAAHEEPIRIDDALDGIARGRITEAFAAGTAAVVAPFAEIVRRGESHRLPAEHPVASRLLDALTARQTGRVPDRRGWLTVA
jgi:branched-chain amino acid aminotransferase